jgi:hypothetical protein
MMTWKGSYHCLNRPRKNETPGSGSFGVKILSLVAFIMALSVAQLYASHGISPKIALNAVSLSVDTREVHMVSDPCRIRFMADPGFFAKIPLYSDSLDTIPSEPQEPDMFTSPLPHESDTVRRDTVPRPSSVMRKSMILPGWGQVVNRQVWKVPIIYGMLAGLTYYSIVMDQNYRDYRAAFYNSQYPDGDQKFGPTPPYIDPNQNPESLRYTRNLYRNRRDLTILGVVLAYGLNIVDAYVFAQMRDFDVSDDLSARLRLGPASLQPGQVVDRFDATSYTSRSTGGYMDGFIVSLKLNLR